MRKLTSSVLAGLAGAAMVAAAVQQPATAAPVSHDGATAGQAKAAAHRTDNRPGPVTKKQLALRQAAIEKVAAGEATPNADGVVKLGSRTSSPRSRRRSRTRSSRSSRSSATRAPGSTARFPARCTTRSPSRTATVDNSTTWTADYNTAYYETLFNGSGESMKTFYEDLSNGQYSVTNEVTDWVKVPYNASFYGDNAIEDFGGSWAFIQDSGDAWWDAQIAAGKTPAEIDAYLAQFDVWDRNDWDNDGNFDEADGYIDHFQAVHAGQGEDAGGGAQGADAIWSHRWYVNGDDFGQTGPTLGTTQNKAGGAQIGDSKYWFGDYTTEPENGGLGVFAHEFGHDLGLPDYYDTAGGENGTAFWTLMSSGSWLSHGSEANEGIGTTPGLMGPEEKLFLGWLDYSEVNAGQSGSFTLNPAQFHERGKDQAVKINLPDEDVSTNYTTPPSGSHAWWTGSADDLNETLTTQVPAELTGHRVGQRVVRHRGRLRLPLRRVLVGQRGELAACRQPGRRHVEGQLDDPALRLRRGWPGDAVPVPVPDGRRRAPARRLPRRHHRQRCRGQRRERSGCLDGRRRVGDQHRHGGGQLPGVLPGREPGVRRLGRHPAGPGRTSSASRTPPRTGWSTSRSRTACSSGTSTTRSRTTTPRSTQVRAWPCRSTPVRPSSSTRTARRRATGGSRWTARSVWRRARRPVSTRRSSRARASRSRSRRSRPAPREARSCDLRRHQPVGVLVERQPAEQRQGRGCRREGHRHR